jgi:hypothetical protein
MSFLDLQDLAMLAAQADFWRVIARWCGEADILVDAIELGIAGGAVGVLLKGRKIDR